MKGCLLGKSFYYYLVSIDNYYVAAWAACTSKKDVPRLIQEMLFGGVVCFAFKSECKQLVIDFMISEDKRYIANNYRHERDPPRPKYKGFPGRKSFFPLHNPNEKE
ncbi:hypothetical protein [Yersinia pseudotuberculosis]|uniref:hypothetical protein n=1 Tax=Yersinia pseudotuberculosis TaxID=633 RepID=UPI001F2C8D5A|nr:hypothetical protein [Yersinia pseudotuberculosis]MCF1165490.1 hypothetical protein [Yersinia pseudotuberculosis]